MESPAGRDPVLVIHHGPPVEIGCERGNQAHRGLSVHGDIDIIPAGMASRWTLRKQDTAFIIRISQDLLADAASQLRIVPGQVVLLNRFQVRDAKLEHLAWALKAEIDDGFTGSLYTEGIGWAMACQLLTSHSVAARGNGNGKPGTNPGSMAPFRLRRMLAYIEENLAGDLSLGAIAAVSGLSVSHCQRAFGRATGMSIHQYVIRRRVERAKPLLADDNLPLSEVALMVGFSHQSHLAYHTRRLLGISPMDVRSSATDGHSA
jgi:AraC family transcriptional regulator